MTIPRGRAREFVGDLEPDDLPRGSSRGSCVTSSPMTSRGRTHRFARRAESHWPSPRQIARFVRDLERDDQPWRKPQLKTLE